jgi:hypothetical protein
MNRRFADQPSRHLRRRAAVGGPENPMGKVRPNPWRHPSGRDLLLAGRERVRGGLSVAVTPARWLRDSCAVLGSCRPPPPIGRSRSPDATAVVVVLAHRWWVFAFRVVMFVAGMAAAGAVANRLSCDRSPEVWDRRAGVGTNAGDDLPQLSARACAGGAAQADRSQRAAGATGGGRVRGCRACRRRPGRPAPTTRSPCATARGPSRT